MARLSKKPVAPYSYNNDGPREGWYDPYYLDRQEEMRNRPKNIPPKVWNGKDLKFAFQLYYKNKLMPNISAYNMDENWFISDGQLVPDVKFLVSRIN